MAKDTDEKINESHTSDTPRMSIREAINSAREEVKAKESEREDAHEEVTEKIEKVKEAKKTNEEPLNKSKLSKSKDDTPDAEEVSDDEDNTEDDDTSEVEEKPKVETKPPVSWKKESKDEWANLSDNVRESILKREKEVSDGFAGTKKDKDRLQEFDSVLSQHMPAFQQQGVHPVQAISKLLEWNSVLTHSNKEIRTNAFKALAANCGVEFGTQSQTQEDTTTEENNSPPAWAQSLITQNQEVQRQLATQRQQSTEGFVNSWAHAKGAEGNLLRPHYANDEIRRSIAALIQTGVVPLENGEITHNVLEQAYQKAIRTNDEIWNQVQEEKQEAEAAKKKSDAQKRAKEVNTAKSKAVSLKPSAPTTKTSNLNGSKPNNKTSVRDSIDAAIREHMG